MTDFRVIIPVRFASTRLPGKPLMDIADKPMLQHVYERALQSGAETVVIATDDNRIKKAAEKFGAHVCMTSPDHHSGTDRLAEAVVALGYEDDDIIVNLQGDEPLIPPTLIHQVANDLAEHDNVKVATLCEPIKSYEELIQLGNVKVAINKRNYAMYFSRSVIPWIKDKSQFTSPRDLTDVFHRHVGLYAYRAGFLQEFEEWEPCSLELMENLEQLRFLWNCVRVHVSLTKVKAPISVDTEEDLEKIRKLIK